jgi:hypothetical protein
MRPRFVLFSSAIALAATMTTGCSPAIVDPLASGSSQASDAGTGGDGGSLASVLPPACGAAQGPLYTPSSDGELTQFLVRAWLQCSGDYDHGAVGLVLRGDGTWDPLVLEGNLVVMAQGFDQGTTWTISQQVISLATSQGIIGVGMVGVEESPPRIQISFESQGASDFVPPD